MEFLGFVFFVQDYYEMCCAILAGNDDRYLGAAKSEQLVRGIDKMRRVGCVEGITRVEAPGDGCTRDACFVRGLDVADFVTDVEHLGGFERKGFADGFEVFCFAGEL